MKTDRYFLRQKLVAYACAHGIKATARAFGCSRNTARKWLRRYRPVAPRSSLSQFTRPHRYSHKVSSTVEGLVERGRLFRQ
jgi:transposase-like protein